MSTSFFFLSSGSESAGGSGPWDTVTVEELRRIRGGMFVTRGNVPFGPRPNQPDNIISLNALVNLQYDDETAKRALPEYAGRPYRHGSIGPFVTTSYHGQDDGISLARFLETQDRVADRIEMMWRAGIIPIAFLSPDNWTLSEMEAFRPVFSKPRWQKLLRMVVPKGYEPSIDTPNKNYCDFFDWSHELLPDALYYLHMVSNFDAPGNNDDLTPTLPTYIGNEGCWRNLTPKMHGWLVQNGPFGIPTQQSPDYQNVCDQFRADVHGSLRDRFHNGANGWPSSSKWDEPRYASVPRNFRGIDLPSGELCAYCAWWENFAEEECRKWGDGTLLAGSDGAFDGCHANVVSTPQLLTAAGHVRTFVKPTAQETPLGKPWVRRQ